MLEAVTFQPALATRRFPGRAGSAVVFNSFTNRLLRLSSKAANAFERLEAGDSVETAAKFAGLPATAVRSLALRLFDAGCLQLDPASTVQRPKVDNSNDLVSVVIPIRGSAFRLQRLLNALTSGSEDMQRIGEIIVVDDASPENLQPVCDAFGATRISNPVSLGPGAARNQGAHRARHRSIAFIDADCIPVSGWISVLSPLLQEPDCALVAPRITTATPSRIDGAGKHPMGILAKFVFTFEIGNSALDMGPHSGSVRPLSNLAYVPSAALMADRDVFVAIGGFAEDLQVGEDVDLVWRLISAGHKVRYVPDVEVAHEARTSVRANLLRRVQYASSTSPLHLRHRGLLAPVVLGRTQALGMVGLLSQSWLGLAWAALMQARAYFEIRSNFEGLTQPEPIAIRLAAHAAIATTKQVSLATWKSYLPLVGIFALRFRKVRRWLLFSALLNLSTRYQRSRRARPERVATNQQFPISGDQILSSPMATVAAAGVLGICSDLAHCVGVWSSVGTTILGRHTAVPAPVDYPKSPGHTGENPPQRLTLPDSDMAPTIDANLRRIFQSFGPLLPKIQSTRTNPAIHSDTPRSSR